MYATVPEIRAEGVTAEQASDAQVEIAIRRATVLIDTLTGQWFEARTCTFRLDGPGAPTLFLRVPVISVQEIRIDGQPIDLAEVVVYNSVQDRRNPRLYYAPGFPKGKGNVEVVGSFGYVEQDGSTPELIKYACRRIVISNLAPLTDKDAQEEKKRVRIASETTDGHSYTLAKDERPAGLTGDPEVDSILAQFMATPIPGSV